MHTEPKDRTSFLFQKAEFLSQGFAAIPGLFSAEQCAFFAKQFGHSEGDAGMRHRVDQTQCIELVRQLRLLPALAGLLPRECVAVQCNYFEKSTATNWLVPIHQDLSIPVAERVSDPALRGWSRKHENLFVQAPREVLEKMLAVRLHLDDCLRQDGPLFVVPGSHLEGVIDPETAVLARTKEVACLARTGDVLLIKPLLLHRSSKASGRSKRRVLHVVFSPAELPLGLRWAHEAR